MREPVFDRFGSDSICRYCGTIYSSAVVEEDYTADVGDGCAWCKAARSGQPLPEEADPA